MFGRDLKFAMIKILTDPTKTLADLEKLAEDPEIQKINGGMTRDFQFIMAGMTPRDIEWQEKVLDQILEETQGWKVEAMSSPEIARWMLLYLVSGTQKFKPRIRNLRRLFSGWLAPTTGLQRRKITNLKNKKKGAISESETAYGGLGGMGGGAFPWGNFTAWDPRDKESLKVEALKTWRIHVKRKWPRNGENQCSVQRLGWQSLS
jgi:hypothetical protein